MKSSRPLFALGVSGLLSLCAYLSAQSPALAATFNVKTFGAKGDGVTDDQSCIQSAFNAANNVPGSTVFFPAGTYLHSSCFLGVNVAVLGDTFTAGAPSSKLLSTGAQSAIILVGGNVSVSKMLIGAKVSPPSFNSPQSTGIFLDNVNGYTLSQNTFTGGFSTIVYSHASSNGQITNNTFNTSGSVSTRVAVVGGNAIQVTTNTFSAQGGIAGGNAVSGNPQFPNHGAEISSNVTVNNNRVVGDGFDLAGSTAWHVEGNTLTPLIFGVRLVGSGSETVSSATVTRNTISLDNTFQSGSAGILLANTANAQVTLNAFGADPGFRSNASCIAVGQNTVTSNFDQNYTLANSVILGTGCVVLGGSNNTFTRNQFVDCESGGFAIGGGSDCQFGSNFVIGRLIQPLTGFLVTGGQNNTLVRNTIAFIGGSGIRASAVGKLSINSNQIEDCGLNRALSTLAVIEVDDSPQLTSVEIINNGYTSTLPNRKSRLSYFIRCFPDFPKATVNANATNTFLQTKVGP